MVKSGSIQQIINSKLDEYISRTGVSGVSAAVIDGNTNIFTGSQGYRDKEKSLPMNTKTLFGIGSVTKSFLSLWYLLAQKKGLLSINDDLSLYIKEFPLAADIIGNIKSYKNIAVKLSHLLEHSSGIPELGFLISQLFRICGVKEQGPFGSEEYSTVLKRTLELSSIRYSLPGEKFMYNNEMYMLLGSAAERASGISLNKLLEDEILSPLGMTSTGLGISNENNSKNIIMGYAEPGLSASPIPLHIPKSIWGAGGLITNIEDMTKYLQFLLGNLKLSGNYSSEVTEQLWEKRIKRFKGSSTYYGLGWFIKDSVFEESLIYHGGDILFSGGVCALLPKAGIGIVIGQNCAGSPVLLDLAIDLFEAILNKKNDNSEKFNPSLLAGSYKTIDNVYSIEIEKLDNTISLIQHYPGVYERVRTVLTRCDSRNLIFRPAGTESGTVPELKFIIRNEQNEIWINYEEYLFKKQ